MSCKYEYYRDEENYFPRLYCSIDNNYCLVAKWTKKYRIDFESNAPGSYPGRFIVTLN